MTAQAICTTIVKCLHDVWTDKMLFDFAVKIADETIQCHRLILAACSDFFKALFRSGMREVTENCVVLKDISSDAFQIILQTLYTGENILTLQNVFEVWNAVHMLQITFMINMCEEFAIKAIAIDTWENIYTNSKVLGSEKIMNLLHLFMLNNFEQISISPTFLQLPCKEFQDLIKSQDLVVSSEDLVMESVIRWVTYDPKITGQINENNREINDIASLNDDQNSNKNLMLENSCQSLVTSETSSRKNKLTELLKNVRTCLVSPAVLSRVLKMKFVLENEDSREIIVDAMSYHIPDVRHGQWPSAAIHRSCSGYVHVGISARETRFRALNARDETWRNIPECEFLQESIQLVNFDGDLYATGKQNNQPNEPCRMFVFCDKTWKEVMEMPGHNLLLVSHGDYIYVLNRDDNVISTVNTRKKIAKLETLTTCPKNAEVKHVMILQHFLLLFCSHNNKSIDETTVHKYDILSKVWTVLENINGPALNMVSFRNDKHSYILQGNGNMWLVFTSPCDKNVEFKFLEKLWHTDEVLHGAVTYKSKLIVYRKYLENKPLVIKRGGKVTGHFQTINQWSLYDNISNFIPLTLPITSFI
ncbi:kelch-like protein 26 [Physella acuta]|uniref:kelch-like protein 26 n=1 Tax=Physella acuta TaxID=109671 RepID=UPI0027DC4CDB|nr:kelch-like protein 26 [Physella acuta]